MFTLPIATLLLDWLEGALMASAVLGGETSEIAHYFGLVTTAKLAAFFATAIAAVSLSTVGLAAWFKQRPAAT